MTRKRKKRKRRHPRPPLPPRGPRLEELLEKARSLQEKGKLREALAVLEEAPAHMQRRGELQVSRGILYVLMGDLSTATEALEEAERLAPDTSFAAFFLAGLYRERSWMSHAARTARRALRLREFMPDDMAETTEMLLEQAETVIREMAARLEISAGTMEKALYHNELAERWVEADRFLDAARSFQKAARLAPTWIGPRNNEALFRFLSGEAQKAIRISEEVLAADPGNLHALANLIRFCVARGDQEEAEAYAERLRHLPLEEPSDVDKAIEALGILGDDEGLYAIYRRSQPFLDELNSIALVTLGSAAANLGHPRIARRLWRQAEKAGTSTPFIERLSEALSRKAPGPGLAERYPTVTIPTLISMPRLEEFGQLMAAWEKEGSTERSLRKQIEGFVARNPHIVQVAAKILWEEQPEVGLHMLGCIGTPAAIAEIERFAFGQAGAIDLRMQAIHILIDLGALDPSQTVDIWHEETQEWHPIRLVKWEVRSDIEPPAYSPRVWELIDTGSRALSEGQLDLAQEKLEAAILLDPQAAIAHHNLAVALQRQGDRATALEHLKRALEIDPEYVFARCTLARYHLFEKDLEAAQEVLGPVLEHTTVTPAEMRYYQLTLADLAMAQEDYQSARRHLEAVLEINPGDETAQTSLTRLEYLEMSASPLWEEWRARERRREEKKRSRPTRPDAGLVECLGRLTKDALIGSARAMPVPRRYNVRKAVLIEDLARFLTDRLWLGEIVTDLSDKEQQALRDVLTAGGSLPWEKFTARYGDDLDESPHWQWHEPETVMGRLRMLGLLSEGTVDDQLLVLVPSELRHLLPPLLEEGR